MVAFAGAVLGDIAGYAIGRIGGRTIVRKIGRFIFLPERRLPILESYFRRYGMRAVLFGRFAPFLRSVRTLVAGIARMPFWRFLGPDVVGAAAWAAGITLSGFVLGESWRVANRYLGAGGAVVLVILALLFFLSWRRVHAIVERELAETKVDPGAAQDLPDQGPGTSK
jgi:membrane protein DedA with SNARE-associated domain